MDDGDVTTEEVVQNIQMLMQQIIRNLGRIRDSVSSQTTLVTALTEQSIEHVEYCKAWNGFLTNVRDVSIKPAPTEDTNL